MDLFYKDALRAAHITDAGVRAYPVVGPWVSKIGHVIDIYQTPSNAGPLLVVEGIFYASTKLIFLKTKPFLQAEEWYRFLNARCGSKRKGIIANFAKGLGFSQKTGMVSTTFKGTTAVVFDGILEFYLKATWYIMIVDYVTDFAYLSASLPYQWSFSVVDDEPHCLARCEPGPGYGPQGYPFSGWHVTDQYGGINCDFVTMSVAQGIAASVTASVTSLPRPNDGKVVKLGIWLVETTTGVSTGFSGPPRINADGSQTVTATYLYDGGDRVGFQNWVVYWISDELPFYASGTFTGTGTVVGKKGLFFDP